MNPELLGWCLILCQNSESQTCWEPPNSGWRKRWLTRQTAAMLSLLYSQSSFTGPPIPRVILLSHCTGHKRLRQLLKKIIFDNPMPMMITSTTWTDRLSKSSTCNIYKIHTLQQSASLLTCNYPVWPSSCIWPCINKILLIIFLIYLICSNFLLWVHSSSTEQLHHYNYQKAELKKKGKIIYFYLFCKDQMKVCLNSLWHGQKPQPSLWIISDTFQFDIPLPSMKISS